MAVVVETTLGDITIDLYTKERPRACLNFLKLCKMKYYNYNLFHTVGREFIAQTGDPTGSRKGGESIFGVLEGPLKRYFEPETHPRIKHTITGLVSFVGAEDNLIGSQFFITLAPELTYLDDRHCVFGEVAEGLDVLELLNEAICDNDNRPYQDIRITHTVVLDDPYPDLPRLRAPSRSPSPSAERLQGGRIAPDEEIDETTGKDLKEIEEMKADREAKARATILEMVGDIPDADMAPPENVLFVCKLNPVTTDDDLEIIFSRFGKINSCEVIRDRKTGDSLQYAFIEFDDSKACEDAYFKMDNVLIDDRRIHVDFSQSVAKVKWLGKGRGVAHFDDAGRRTDDKKNDIGQGNYKASKSRNKEENWEKRPTPREQPSKSKNEERSSRDNDRETSPRNQQRFSGDRQRSSRVGQRPSRDEQRSSRNEQRPSRDEQRPLKDEQRSSRDEQRFSRDQQRSSRNQQQSSRERQRSPDTFRRYKSPSRSDRRSGRYPEERRGRAQYRSYPTQQRRPERNYNFEERRRGDHYDARSYDQSKRRIENRSGSREEYRRPDERKNWMEEEQSKRHSKKKESSSSEGENAKSTLKSKACGKKKSRRSSSSSSSSSEDSDSMDRKKSQSKLKRRKKESESEEDSSDSSDDSYKKEKMKGNKKKKKHEDSSE